MKVSIHIVTAIVILGFTHYVPAQKLISLNLPQFDVHDADWEKQLETGIVALEANCNENDIPFNREKVTRDLRNCLHPIITQESMSQLDPFQKHLTHDEVFRHIYIEPVCNKVSMSMACLKPHRKIIENCARDDGKALQEMLKSICKSNGTKLVEFIKEGGFECITSRAEEFANCFKAKNGNEISPSSEDVCSYFRTVRDCAMSAFNKCEKKMPAKIVRSILDEVTYETSGRCFDALKDEGNESSSASQLQNIFYTLISILFLAKRL